MPPQPAVRAPRNLPLAMPSDHNLKLAFESFLGLPGPDGTPQPKRYPKKRIQQVLMTAQRRDVNVTVDLAKWILVKLIRTPKFYIYRFKQLNSAACRIGAAYKQSKKRLHAKLLRLARAWSHQEERQRREKSGGKLATLAGPGGKTVNTTAKHIRNVSDVDDDFYRLWVPQELKLRVLQQIYNRLAEEYREEFEEWWRVYSRFKKLVMEYRRLPPVRREALMRELHVPEPAPDFVWSSVMKHVSQKDLANMAYRLQRSDAMREATRRVGATLGEDSLSRLHQGRDVINIPMPSKRFTASTSQTNRNTIASTVQQAITNQHLMVTRKEVVSSIPKQERTTLALRTEAVRRRQAKILKAKSDAARMHEPEEGSIESMIAMPTLCRFKASWDKELMPLMTREYGASSLTRGKYSNASSSTSRWNVTVDDLNEMSNMERSLYFHGVSNQQKEASVRQFLEQSQAVHNSSARRRSSFTSAFFRKIANKGASNTSNVLLHMEIASSEKIQSSDAAVNISLGVKRRKYLSINKYQEKKQQDEANITTLVPTGSQWKGPPAQSPRVVRAPTLMDRQTEADSLNKSILAERIERTRLEAARQQEKEEKEKLYARRRKKKLDVYRREKEILNRPRPMSSYL